MEEKEQQTKIETGLEAEQQQEEQKALDIISAANTAAARVEAANKELAQLLAKQERMKVEATFGGTSEAGVPGMSKEEAEIEETRKMLEGTGYDELLFPKKK